MLSFKMLFVWRLTKYTTYLIKWKQTAVCNRMFVQQGSHFHCLCREPEQYDCFNLGKMHTHLLYVWTAHEQWAAADYYLTFKWKIINVSVNLQGFWLLFTHRGNMKQDVRILLLGERKLFSLVAQLLTNQRTLA